MTQFNFGNLESPLSGNALINGNLEPWRDALHTMHKGPTRPTYAVPGLMWVKDGATPWIVNIFDGADDIAIGTVNATSNVFLPSGLDLANISGITAFIKNLLDDVDAATARTTLGVSNVPAGAVMPFANSTVPSGWLECDGTSQLRATYPDLFTAIGIVYGSVDGTHFNLPDLRGEFVRGWSHGRAGVDTGRAVGSAQAEMIGPHTHPANLEQLSNGSGAVLNRVSNANTVGPTATSVLSNIGTENRPRNVAMMYCIKT